MNNQHNVLSRDDYQALQKALEELECVSNLDELIVNLNAGLKAWALLQDAGDLGAEAWADEIHDELKVFNALHILSSIKKNNDGLMNLPSLNDLSPQEKADIKRWRVIERAVELKGDKKALEKHRKNLKSMFEAERIIMNDNKELIRDAKKTWEALDAELEGDIMYADTLTPGED